MKRYILIGDSQAVGLRVPLAAAMEAKGFIEDGVAAHVGWSTSRMATSGGVRRIVDNQDLAIVILGGNDSAGGNYPYKIAQLLAQLHGIGRVVWIGPAAVSQIDAHTETIAIRKTAVAEAQARVVPQYGAAWIDGVPMTRDIAHAPDGLHFPRAGQRVWAERIAEALYPTRGALAAAASSPWAVPLVLVSLAALGGLFWYARAVTR